MPLAPLTYLHRYEPGHTTAAPPLLLLHGTGGDEHDLIPPRASARAQFRAAQSTR